ncbi:superoxide dismutase [Candidatus Azambacteria bacterium]|nr:superoxide dismutase [Candidatus Azambacteria bacterium]
MREQKPLKYTQLDGLSERQLKEHHDVLYVGYVNKLNEIEEKLKNSDRAAANGTYAEFRELKKEEVFATNGIYLHEYYFENLGGGGTPTEKAKEILAKDFGSYEKWEEDFRACGLAARVWVVLAYNFEDGKLRNYVSDTHDIGGVWGCMPLLVLDVYEHAYFLDYGTKRKDYIGKFMANVNWDEFVRRYDKLKK